jgi:stage V sporulation protein G
MEITEVKVFPIQEEKLKAFVSIVFDQCFMVNDIKIIQGRDGLFISMPSRKKKNGEFKDVAHPLNNETRRMIEDKVLGEYERILAERGEQLPVPPYHLGDAAAAASPMAVTSVTSVTSVASSAPAASAPPPVVAAAAFRAAGAAGLAGSDGSAAAGGADGSAPAAGADGSAALAGRDGHQGQPGQNAAPPPSPPKPPEKTLEEIEEMHLRDSFWTVP